MIGSDQVTCPPCSTIFHVLPFSIDHLNGFTSIWNFDNELITVAAGVFAKMTCTKISITWINHEKHFIREFSPGKTQSTSGERR